MSERSPFTRREANRLALGGGAVFGLLALVSIGGEPTAQPTRAPAPAEDRLAVLSEQHSDLKPLEEVQYAPAGAPPQLAQLESPARFIVRIKGDSEIDQCVSLFRKDPAGAKALFEAWAKKHPEVRDFELAGATYSGEVILAYPFSDPRALEAARNQLLSMEGVRYADPDFTAQPSIPSIRSE